MEAIYFYFSFIKKILFSFCRAYSKLYLACLHLLRRKAKKLGKTLTDVLLMERLTGKEQVMSDP